MSLLKESGVTTVAGHAHEYMRRAGWDQGFGRYDLIPGLVWYPDLDENITAKPLSDLAQKQLGELGELGADKRFFAWYHFLDPHAKWQEHRKDGLTPWGSKSRDLYDGEVTYADQQIGKLLDFVAAQPWAARTVIVFTSDHGEGVGDHSQNYHGYQVWGDHGARAALRVRARPRAAPHRHAAQPDRHRAHRAGSVRTKSARRLPRSLARAGGAGRGRARTRGVRGSAGEQPQLREARARR